MNCYRSNMPPKVTVIVASYNNARYLPACLDSLLHQTFTDFEALVVDDCSTDNSLEICQQYSKRDPRIRVITTEKNRGVIYTKHLGLEEAHGDYVAVLDSDDVALPQRLAKQAAWLDSHPDTVLVAGYYGVIDANDQVIKRQKKAPLNDTSIRWWLTFGTCLIHSTVMYRREPALACGGYDIAFVHGEDIDLMSKLLARGKFEAIPHVMSYWRSHQSSVTKYVSSEERERDYVALIKRSIQLQTKQEVDLDVAAAVFYNTKRPAKNAAVFKAGVETMIRAFDYYYHSEEKSPAEQKALARSFIKHVSRLRKRNKKQAWWSNGKSDWTRALKFLISEKGYRWYLDKKLFTKLKLIDLFQLTKISFTR
jgi:glycosyltransferase involved in cell wall biosynthesis